MIYSRDSHGREGIPVGQRDLNAALHHGNPIIHHGMHAECEPRAVRRIAGRVEGETHVELPVANQNMVVGCDGATVENFASLGCERQLSGAYVRGISSHQQKQKK